MQEAHTAITVNVKREFDTDIVEVAGEIDIDTAPHLNDALSDLTSPHLVIDMRRVEFIDSSGLYCLIRAQERYDGEAKVRLIVRRPGPVFRLLELADLTEEFVIEVITNPT